MLHLCCASEVTRPALLYISFIIIIIYYYYYYYYYYKNA